MVLVTIILIFFLTLILLHFLQDDIIEGATGNSDKTDSVDTSGTTYTDPDLSKDPVYLATVNAANISYLYKQVANIPTMNQQIIDLSSNISDLSTGVDQVNSQMQETSSQLTGGYDASSTDVSDIPQATGLD